MKPRITYANVAATLALFFALGGTAVAAKHYLISSTSQIKPSVLNQFHGKAGPAGPAGPGGPQGPQGPAGTNGTAGRNGTNGTNGSNGTNGATNVVVREGPPVVVEPGARASATAECKPGERATGGGSPEIGLGGLYVYESSPVPYYPAGITPTGWKLGLFNVSGLKVQFTARVVCASP